MRTHRTMGVCFGPAGVGNTLSARRHAHGDVAAWLLPTWGPRAPSDAHVSAAWARSRTVCHTPTVGGTLRALRQDLARMTTRVDIGLQQEARTNRDGTRGGSTAAVEELRARFERTTLGWRLIGRPGIETRLARSPQLSSRVGFAPHSRPLQGDARTFVLTRPWRTLGLSLDRADLTDTPAMAAISRITNGNFRLLHKLFVQSERIRRINALRVLTEDVVEAARSTLVIGATER